MKMYSPMDQKKEEYAQITVGEWAALRRRCDEVIANQGPAIERLVDNSGMSLDDAKYSIEKSAERSYLSGRPPKSEYKSLRKDFNGGSTHGEIAKSYHEMHPQYAKIRRETRAALKDAFKGLSLASRKRRKRYSEAGDEVDLEGIMNLDTSRSFYDLSRGKTKAGRVGGVLRIVIDMVADHSIKASDVIWRAYVGAAAYEEFRAAGYAPEVWAAIGFHSRYEGCPKPVAAAFRVAKAGVPAPGGMISRELGHPFSIRGYLWGCDWLFPNTVMDRKSVFKESHGIATSHMGICGSITTDTLRALGIGDENSIIVPHKFEDGLPDVKRWAKGIAGKWSDADG